MFQWWNKGKLWCARKFAQNKVPYLTTICGGDKTLDLVDFSPVVCKPNKGSRGQGSKLRKKLSKAQGFKYVVQPYCKEAKEIARVIVLNNKALGATKVVTQNGEWRANVSRGGESKVQRMSPLLQKTALKAAKICGLKFAGVDLVKIKSKWYVLEANSAPGFCTFSELTGVDVAGKLAHVLIKRGNK
ncbi:MAG: RimK family alpha-L-glutamate ligase [Candidatus Nanoarchaeia archaeon]